MAFSLTPDIETENILNKRGIDVSKILAMCDVDMNNMEEYGYGMLLLMHDRLILISCPTDNGVKVFGKEERKKKGKAIKLALPRYDELKIDEYLLSEISSSGIETMVSCGLFFISGNLGHEILCGFTGQYSEGVRRFDEYLKAALEKKDFPKEEVKNEINLKCPKCGNVYPDPDRKLCPKCYSKKNMFLRMLSYFKPYKFHILGIVLISLLMSALTVILPYVSGTLYFDGVLGKNESFFDMVSFLKGPWEQMLGLIIGIVIVISILQHVGATIEAILVANIVPNVVKKIKSDVFASLNRLSLKFFQNKQTGGLMTRVLTDANEVSGFFIDGLPYLFSNTAKIIIILIIMTIINWKMAISAVILTPLLLFCILKLQPKLWHLHGRRHRTTRGMSTLLNDTFAGARVIKSFGKEESAGKGFAKKNEAVADTEIAVVKYESLYAIILEGVKNITVLLIWTIGAILIVGKTSDIMSYGMLATYVTYVGQLNGPLEYMVNLVRSWASSMNAAQRIFEIVDTPPDIAESANAIEMVNPKGKLEIQDISFSYEKGHKALQNITATVEAEKMLGVVGRSGAGKTTLISLISRLYDPDSGRILIDGRDIREYTLNSLRKNIAVVSQESYVFIGTVAENISYARPDATMEEIIAAAKAASAHDFICKMPDGYETMIGAGYRQVSGGERQRLSVARAILSDPKILILDEATASVDTETERKIQKALDKLTKGRTTISIAHRLSTLKNADTLVVIDEGKLVESGTHEELMNKKGIYFKLVELQTDALLNGLKAGRGTK